MGGSSWPRLTGSEFRPTKRVEAGRLRRPLTRSSVSRHENRGPTSTQPVNQETS